MESDILKKGINNSIFVLLSQVIKLILGISKILLLPLILGITNFGYWQVYLLYLSYVGIFTLGFNDGIYLKYGKYDYNELPKQKFRSSIKLFFILQLIITCIVFTLIMFEPDENKKNALIFATINIPIASFSGVLIYILQVTNQLKKYSFYTILDQVLLLIVILIALFTQTNNYLLIIFTDFISKIIVLLLMIRSCKELIFGNGVGLNIARKELNDNIRVGIKLMIANFAGMMILGFGRFVVERFENIDVHSSYSFANSTINLVLIFISALGLVVYPTFSRINLERYSVYFLKLNNLIRILVFILLVSYFPLKFFIEEFMNEYKLVFDYLPIIFAIIFLQSKMQILINPFYKLLREERAMMVANITGLVFAIVTITVSYLVIQSVFIIALSTFFAMAVRLYLSENFIKKKLGIYKDNGFLFEVFYITMFIVCAYQVSFPSGIFGYTIILMLYLLTQLKFIKKNINYFMRG